MKTLTVSLDVLSYSLTLDDLIRMFGPTSSLDSFSRGDIGPLGRVRQYSLLRFESAADDGAPCDEHIATLKTDIDRIDAWIERAGGSEVDLLLNIGVFFTTADGSVTFSAVALRNTTTPLGISVSAYPVGESCTEKEK